MASLCPVPFGYLSSLVESSGTLLLVLDHTFYPRLYSVEEVFPLRQLSRMVMIKPHLFTYQHRFFMSLDWALGPIYIYIYKYAFIDVLPLQVTTNFLNPLNIYKYIYNLI